MARKKTKPSFFLTYFMEDYNEMAKAYDEQEELEFASYLLHVCVIHRIGERVTEVKSVAKGWKVLRQKYGDKFIPFEKARLQNYFQFDVMPVPRDTAIDSPKAPQNLTLRVKDRPLLLRNMYDFLSARVDELQQLLRDREDLVRGRIGSKGSTKRKVIRRYPSDSQTCLTIEQTTLFVHYLQQEEVLLRAELIKNTTVSQAISQLTGYNTTSFRNYLSSKNIRLNKNPENLQKLSNLLKQLQKNIDSDLKKQ